MPYKDKEVRRVKGNEYSKAWRARNPDKHKNTKKNWDVAHRKERAEWKKKDRAKNPELYRFREYIYRTRKTNEVLTHLGGVCVMCGIDDRDVLTLDHINDNGHDERKRLGWKAIYRRALEHKEEYQILCWNCQHRKRLLQLRKRWPRQEN